MALAWFRQRGPVHRIPGGKTQTFTSWRRGGTNHRPVVGWSEVRLGHSGLGLGQGHQVSRLAGQRQACDTVTCHPCNQVLGAVASPEPWKVMGQSHLRLVYKVKTPANLKNLF